jgi:hypothetical protein
VQTVFRLFFGIATGLRAAAATESASSKQEHQRSSSAQTVFFRLFFGIAAAGLEDGNSH